MKMIDNCGCDKWSVAFAKYLFEKNHIPCKEAHIVNADHKWINIIADVRSLDSATGETIWEERKYTIKYWVDWKCLFLKAVSFRFFDSEQKTSVDSDEKVKIPILVEYIDQGNYWLTSVGGFVRFKAFRD